MKKYLVIFLSTIKEYFAYRLSFVLWRLRVVLSLLIVFFLWSAVFDKNQVIAHYSKTAFLSYLLFSHVVSTVVFGTRTVEIAGDINNGSIINLLLKPISFFKYYFYRDLADKALNFFFVSLEVLILISFLKISIVAPSNFLLFLIFVINGVFISFYINLVLSFVGFWTTEVWAPRFVFTILVFFLAGYYFPLDLLPPIVYRLLLITPFPYLFYLPARLLVGKADQLIYWQLLFSFFWVFLSYHLASFIWVKGNKNFSFWGR